MAVFPSMRKSTSSLCVALLLLVALSTEVASAPAERYDGKIWLKSGSIDVSEEPPAVFPKASRRALSAATGSCQSELESLRLYILTMKDVVDDKSHKEITSAFNGQGVISSYIPDNSYLVFAKPSVVEKAGALGRILWAGEFKSKHKVPSNFYLDYGDMNSKQASPLENSAWFNVHLPQNLDQLRVSTCSGQKNAAWLAQNLCNKAAKALEQDGVLACKQASPNRVLFGINKGKVLEFVSWVTEQPEVHSIDHSKNIQLHNFHANAIIQAGKAEDVDFETSSYVKEYLPAWESGLRGENQTVGISDSGLSYDSCFFKDDFYDVFFNTFGEKKFTSSVHRKIDMYRCLNDCKDGSGHGTHVAGTLAGESSSSSFSSQYDGVAPKARIAFTDLGRSIFNILLSPNVDDLFGKSYERGVRVHSDSWGSQSGDASYDSMSHEVDEFTWKHKDFLSVFPVGNSGTSNTYYSISSPAVAKNAIAVGATLNYEKNKQVYVASGVTTLNISNSKYFNVMGPSSFVALEAMFGGEDAFKNIRGKEYEIAIAEPKKACSEIVNSPHLSNKIALIKRGKCKFTEKVRAAQKAGAVGVLIYNNKNKGNYYMGASKTDPADDVTIPSYSISLRHGKRIQKSLEDQEEVKVFFSPTTAEPPTWETLAEYSSVGPTFDERTKPDIVAPGNLESAGHLTQLHTCYTSQMSGTSMATPVVAGAAILIRQFFVEGRFKVQGASKFTNPSGSLIKAALLNGATEMIGYNENGYPIDAVPSFEQGFGRVLLKNSLPLESDSFNLFVEDEVPIQSGDIHTYCIETRREGSLSVTLTWYDPPSDLLALRTLVNDLDLTVHTADHHSFVGNGEMDDSDRVNNVEQVKLHVAAEGRYIIEVKAHRIAQLGQTYALVASGDFLHGDSRCTKTNFARIVTKPNLKSNESEVAFTADVYDSQNQEKVEVEDSRILCKLSDCSASNQGMQPSPYHDWTSCGTSKAYSNLPDGSHCFSVKYNDPSYNSGENADDVYRFQIDTTPPTTTILQSPSAATGKTEAEITFSSNEESTTEFFCNLVKDGRIYEDTTVSCSSPVTYTHLDDGVYTFTVQGRDAFGNLENPGAEVTWTIDTKAPRTKLLSAPSISNGTEMTFTFESPDSSSPTFAGFKCGVVFFYTPGPPLEDRFENNWINCASPFVLGGYTSGLYAFGVKAFDTAGNYDLSPEFTQFFVDTTAPTVVLYSTPPTQTNLESLIYHFKASESDATTECAFGLVSAYSPWENCTSPIWYMGLEEGLYLFKVRAQDPVGNVGDFIQAYVHVDRSAPLVNATAEMVRTIDRPDIKIAVDIDDGPGSGIGYSACRLQKQLSVFDYETVSAWSPCEDMKEMDVPKVDDGKYIFEVSAQDTVGNSVFYRSDEVLVDTVAPLVNITHLKHKANGSMEIYWRTWKDSLDIGPGSISYWRCTLKEVVSTFVEYETIKEDSTHCITPHRLYNLPPGDYKFEVTAVDTAGNPSDVDVQAFTIKKRSAENSEKKLDLTMIAIIGGVGLIGISALLFSLAQYKKHHRQKKKQHVVTAQVIGIPIGGYEPEVASPSCRASAPSMDGCCSTDQCTPVVELTQTTYPVCQY